MNVQEIWFDPKFFMRKPPLRSYNLDIEDVEFEEIIEENTTNEKTDDRQGSEDEVLRIGVRKEL